jgi:hypothetical protein
VVPAEALSTPHSHVITHNFLRLPVDIIPFHPSEAWSTGDGSSGFGSFGEDTEDPLTAIRAAFPSIAPSLARLVKSGTDRRWFTVDAVEAWFRVLAAAIFAIAAAFVMSYVVVLVTARVPDPAKFPPLPDIVLDTLPPIAGAFAASEYIGVVLTSIFVGLMSFHRHRAVILRRYFIILGTLFGMRSITMIVTSLSVPDATQDRGQVERLRAIAQGDQWHTLLFSIFTGMGLSISGVQSMGDYCFSGHATTLTLTTEFICRYSRRSWEGLRVISWVLCISAFFCILAARAHYTLDVIIAFYLTQRLFSHYHSLCALEPSKRGANTTFGIFPLWRFLEADCVGDPPAEYEWPPAVKFVLVLLGLL